jgi:voltage-gated potassium channel
LEWLTGIPGSELKPQAQPPKGHWVVAGFGRFGSAVAGQLDQRGMDLTIIHPDPEQVKAHPLRAGKRH